MLMGSECTATGMVHSLLVHACKLLKHVKHGLTDPQALLKAAK
jgi:hypothetical protein